MSLKPGKPRLKSYTVELEYLLPVYQTVVVRVPAGTPIEKVCDLAQEKGGDWPDGGNHCYEGSTSTYVCEIVEGSHENCHGDHLRRVQIPPAESQKKVVIEEVLGARMEQLASALGLRVSQQARRRGKAVAI